MSRAHCKCAGFVGVTAGASAPEDIVQEVIQGCNPAHGFELMSVVEEEEYFPPPSQLRELVIDINYAIDKIFASKRNIDLEITDSKDLNSV